MFSPRVWNFRARATGRQRPTAPPRYGDVEGRGRGPCRWRAGHHPRYGRWRQGNRWPAQQPNLWHQGRGLTSLAWLAPIPRCPPYLVHIDHSRGIEWSIRPPPPRTEREIGQDAPRGRGQQHEGTLGLIDARGAPMSSLNQWSEEVRRTDRPIASPCAASAPPRAALSHLSRHPTRAAGGGATGGSDSSAHGLVGIEFRAPLRPRPAAVVPGMCSVAAWKRCPRLQGSLDHLGSHCGELWTPRLYPAGGREATPSSGPVWLKEVVGDSQGAGEQGAEAGEQGPRGPTRALPRSSGRRPPFSPPRARYHGVCAPSTPRRAGISHAPTPRPPRRPPTVAAPPNNPRSAAGDGKTTWTPT